MAEITRALTAAEEGLFMPHLEMLKPAQREIYKAVGEYLVMTYELAGELESEGSFLVRLHDGRFTAFMYETMTIGGSLNDEERYLA